MVTPEFSVAIATYGRGSLIAPTLESVARQTHRNFEVMVVSDGPAAPGLESTIARFGEEFRLVETPERCGSQYGPNNLGWSMANGRYIAYLGHDDIWLPGHLDALARAFNAHPGADFAASGCIQFGPPGSGSELTWVTGIFDPADSSVASTHFFPPSSVAHRVALPGGLRWPDARATRRPVDSQFMLTAAQEGCVFTSTTKVTVLKFNSALRYLSYLSPDTDEQDAALSMMDDPVRMEELIATTVAGAESSGNFMVTRHATEDELRDGPGDSMRRHARIRGIDLPSVTRLVGKEWVGIEGDDRGHDWHGVERDSSGVWRWSGPNPRPRILIPFTHNGGASITLYVDSFIADDVRESVEVRVNGSPARKVIKRDTDGFRFVIEIEAQLRADKPSVLQLEMNRSVAPNEIDPESPDMRRLGMCLTAVSVESR